MTNQGMERRLVLRVLKYWRSKGEGQTLPSLSEIKQQEIEDLWPYCFVLQTQSENDPVFRYCGDAFVSPPGSMLPYTRVSELPPRSLIAQAMAIVPEVLERRVPITRGGEFQGRHNKLHKYRSIILPLSKDGDTLTHLFGAVNSRSFD